MPYVDPQVQAFLQSIAEADAPPLHEGTPEDARAGNRELLRQVAAPGPLVHSVEDLVLPTRIGDVAARYYQTSARPGERLIVYLHGGGWVTGDLDAHDGLCRELCVRANADVVNLDYLKAPEHPFPEGFDQAFAAIEWLDEHRVDGRPLVLAGDSSGGNMAAAAALRAAHVSGPRVALQVLLYPVLDHDFSTRSYTEFSQGYIVGRAEMEWFWNQYAPDPETRSHPYASPVRASDLRGVAPAIIVTASLDPLLTEAELYRDRLQGEGIDVRYLCFEGMTHGFMSFTNVFDVAGEAIAQVSESIVAMSTPTEPASR